MEWSAAICWIVLRPLIASMATLALNSGLWVRRLLIGGSPFQGRCPASEVNDGGCPEKPVHLSLTLVQQGNAFAYRQYLKQCDEWAYLDREKLAQRYRVGVWRYDGGIQRPWDWRAVNRGTPRQPSQRPVTLTIINDRTAPASSPGRRWYCANVGSWERAQQLLREGHTYLDGDGDGEACEALR
jgi:hypothetical protein